MSNKMTTFFGRRIDAMYQGCNRSSLVAVSIRERELLEGLSTSCAQTAESLSFLFHPPVLKGSR